SARRTIGTMSARLSRLITVLKRMLSMPAARSAGTRSRIFRESPGTPRARSCLVEKIERNVELVEAGVPERTRPLDRQHAAVGDESNVPQPDRARDAGDEVFEIASQERFAAGERDHDGREVAGGVGKAARFLGARGRIGFPVVAEIAAGVAP